jgi:uncharacterized protein YjiS (DUF1127 family)
MGRPGNERESVMEIVRFGHDFDATPVSTRHDFGLPAPHRSAAVTDSHQGIFSFPGRDPEHDEIAQIAMILAIFESAGSSTFDGNQRCEKCISGSPIPNLPLPARSHHVAVQQADSLPKQERNRKVISLKTISQKLKAWRRHRDAMRELSQLSDHDLSDIGIGRGEIEYVSRRPAASKASA